MATAVPSGGKVPYYFAPPPPVTPTATPRPGVPALPTIPKPILIAGQPSPATGGTCGGSCGPGMNNGAPIPAPIPVGGLPAQPTTTLGAPSLVRAEMEDAQMNRNWLWLAVAFAAGYYVGKK